MCLFFVPADYFLTSDNLCISILDNKIPSDMIGQRAKHTMYAEVCIKCEHGEYIIDQTLFHFIILIILT